EDGHWWTEKKEEEEEEEEEEADDEDSDPSFVSSEAYNPFKGRDLIIPDAPPYEFPAPPSPDSLFDLRGRTIQVIVKISSIHLTPDQPRFAGGPWHLNGMKNESIIASGIYYYESQNISESKLNFRTAVKSPLFADD